MSIALLEPNTTMMAAPCPLAYDPREFDGKRVLVTGGTKGVGEAIVRRLTLGGAVVAATARSAPPEGQTPTLFVQADTSTPDGVLKVADAVLERFGGVDILVHNVGGSAAPGGGFQALTDDDWLHELNTNLLAAVRLDRRFLPGMLERRSGVILHISSIQHRLPLYQSTLAYAAAKAGLSTWMEALRNRVARYGVNVVTVKPGFMDTRVLDQVEKKPKGALLTSPERGAELILAAARRGGSPSVFVPWFWWPLAMILRHLPSFVFRRLNI